MQDLSPGRPRDLEPYRPRPVRPLGLWQDDGWRLKAYGISYDSPSPSPALIAAARRLARTALPRPAIAADRYGVGFVGVHQGRGADVVFVDWWANENEIRHLNFTSPSGEADRLEPASEAILCVWDLRVLEFERRAWMETVLRNAGGPDLDAYLAMRLDEEV